MLELQDLVLNFNYVVLNFSIAAISSGIVTILSIWIARRKKIRALYLFGLHFLLLSLSCVFEALAELFLNIPLRNVSMMCNVLALLAFILFFNFIRKESLISLDISIWAAFSGIILFLEFQPANHYIITGSFGGITTLARVEILNNAMELAIVYYALLIVYWLILTFIKSPKNLKKDALLLISSLPISALILYTISLFIQIHEAFSWVIFTFDTIILIVLTYRPQLLFVLPFRAYRLTVIDPIKGLSLFQYEWSSESIDENLLSGLISAIRSMGEEILKRGGIRQIDWELGLLFFSKREHTLTTLLSSKASKSLRSSISAFSKAFEVKFKEELESELLDLGRFEMAKELIDEYFTNIPQYK